MARSARPVRLVVFDFDGVFTDNTVWTTTTGNEWVRCWRGDGLGLGKLRAGWHPGVGALDRDEPWSSPQLREARHPLPPGPRPTSRRARGLAASRRVALSDVAYVGNDINDAGCLRAGRRPDRRPGRAPGRAAARALPDPSAGGFGAVREVCDWLSASVAVAGRTVPHDRPRGPFRLDGRTAVVTGGLGRLGGRLGARSAPGGARVAAVDLPGLPVPDRWPHCSSDDAARSRYSTRT